LAALPAHLLRPTVGMRCIVAA